MAKENKPIIFDETYRGQPPYYDTPDKLWAKAVEYFKAVTTTSGIIRATISGVTRHCGFSSRSSWKQYADRSPEFLYTVESIKMIVVEWYERNLHGYNWAGSAFALRNMDSGNWKDETHQNVTQTVTEVKPQVVEVATPLASKEDDIVP